MNKRTLAECDDYDVCNTEELLYLLLNYDSEEEVYQRSLWSYNYNNLNVRKYIDNINDDGTLKDENFTIDTFNRMNIFKAFKFVHNF